MARLIALLAILSFVWTAHSTAPPKGPPSPKGPPPPQRPKVPCDNLMKRLSSCTAYVTSKSPMPGKACCLYAKALHAVTDHKKDKTDVCECLKKKLPSIPHYNKTTIPALPKKCGFECIVPAFDNSTDCSKISYGLNV